VLQILPRLQQGGVERGTIDMAIAMQRAGWQPLVVSAGGPMAYELKRENIPHIELPVYTKKPWKMRANAKLLEQIIRQYHVDLVHARSRAPAWSAYWACQKMGIPYVTTFHGTYNMGPWALKKRYNQVMTYGARVIAISQHIADHMQQVYDVPQDRMRLIHRGVDVDKFDPQMISAARKIRLAQHANVPDDAHVVILPGRLTRWKGQLVFLRAIAKMQRKDVCALLVGSDQGRKEYRAELEQEIRNLDIGARVRIIDDCDDMPAIYALSQVVVSASTDPEAFGRVMVEGQAMGRLVVGSDHGGSQETVRPGETGWLTPPGDEDALAAALDMALNMPEPARHAMGKAGMAHVRQHFTKHAMTQATLDVYWDVLEPKYRGLIRSAADYQSGL
jgi:glycosyltransferase involved in cell wall biosynthesis